MWDWVLLSCCTLAVFVCLGLWGWNTFFRSPLKHHVVPHETQTAQLATTEHLPQLKGLLEVDGRPCRARQLVLVKDQLEAHENGVYEAHEGNWKRQEPTVAGTEIHVLEGATQSGKVFHTSVTQMGSHRQVIHYFDRFEQMFGYELHQSNRILQADSDHPLGMRWVETPSVIVVQNESMPFALKLDGHKVLESQVVDADGDMVYWSRMVVHPKKGIVDAKYWGAQQRIQVAVDKSQLKMSGPEDWKWTARELR